MEGKRRQSNSIEAQPKRRYDSSRNQRAILPPDQFTVAAVTGSLEKALGYENESASHLELCRNSSR
jgi:hypothetical protein